MCLILFAWQTHPRYPLIVAANRDEFHDRPTAAAAFWEKAPDMLAGRDLQAGGTWLGVSRTGRFAAISNYREPLFKPSSLESSRGHLVRDFLLDDSAPASYADYLHVQGDKYRGFNVLLGNSDSLLYVSNRVEKPAIVPAGVHGLSNHLLDTDWPKVHLGCEHLGAVLKDEQIDPEALLALLADESAAPRTSLSLAEMQSEPEKMTKRIFIQSPVYGTRSSTVLLIDRSGEVNFIERQYDAGGKPTGTGKHTFRINRQS